MVQVSKSSSVDSLVDEAVAKPSDLSHIQLSSFQPIRSINHSNNYNDSNQSINQLTDINQPSKSINQSIYENLDIDSESDLSPSPSLAHRSFDGSLSEDSDDEQIFEAENKLADQSTNQSINESKFHNNSDDKKSLINQSIDKSDQSLIECDPDDIPSSIIDVIDPVDQSINQSIEISEKKPPTWKVFTALITAQLCWSGFHVIAKGLFNDGLIPPQVLPAFRTIGVVPIQAAWSWRTNKKFYVMSRRHHLIMFATAILGNTISQQFFNFGESLSSATLAGSMQPMIPVLTTVFAIALRREIFSWFKALGVMIAVAGSLIVVLLGSSSGNSSNGPNPVGGAMCFLVQTACTSMYITLQKPLFQQGISVDTFNFYLFLYGGIGHLILGAVYSHEVVWASLPWTIIPILFYVSIVSSFLAFLFFVYAVKHLPASISSLAICLQSFFSPTLGAIFLGESMSLIGVFGGLLIVAGIVLVVYVKNRETKTDQLIARQKLEQLESINCELEMLNQEMANSELETLNHEIIAHVNQSQAMNQSINQSPPLKSMPNNQSINSSINQSINQSVSQIDDSDSDSDDEYRFGYPQKSAQIDSDSEEDGI